MMLVVGDRGYGLKTWLMTPLANLTTPQEVRYNLKHARARSVVERTIGLLKSRWMCLDAAGGMLLYRPEKICQIVLACCVLHNIAMARGVPAPYGPHAQPEPVGDEMHAPAQAALQARLQLIQRL